MLRYAAALFLLQATPQAPVPAAVEPAPGWHLAGSQQGCVVHTAYQGGTVLSVFALPHRAGIGFLLQNPEWSSLQDGAHYPLQVRFEDGGEWSLAAVARLNIDADGPGLFFAVSPAAGEGELDFMTEFAAAPGMHILTEGAVVDRLALRGSREATVALAQCLGQLVNQGQWSDEDPLGGLEDTPAAIKI